MFDFDRIIGRGAIAIGLLTAAGGLALVPDVVGGDTQQGLTGLGAAGFGIGLAAAFFFIGRASDRRASARARWPDRPFRWEEDWETGEPFTSVEHKMARVIAAVLVSAAALAIVMAGEAIVQTSRASGDEAEWSENQRAAHSASLFMPVVAIGLSIAAVWATYRKSRLARLRVQLSPMPPVLGAPLAGAILWRGSAGDAEVVVRAACVADAHRTTVWEHQETLRFRPGSQSRATFSFPIAPPAEATGNASWVLGVRAPALVREPLAFLIPVAPDAASAAAPPLAPAPPDTWRPIAIALASVVLGAVLIRTSCSKEDVPTATIEPARAPSPSEIFADAGMPALVAALSDTHEEVRRAAAERLERVSPDDLDDAIPALAIAAEDPSPFVRGAALYTLMRAGPKAAPAVPALIRVVSNPDLLDQDIAALALAKIGLPAAAPAIEPMRAAAAHAPRSDQREAISKALADLEGTP